MSRCVMHVGDVFHHMATIPDHSVDLIVTSPPFLALRSYLPADHPDKHLEIGSEATPAAYLSTLLALTREWRRILAPHGSICVELGDTYSGVGGTSSAPNPAYGEARSMERKGGDLLAAENGWRKAADLKHWPLPKSLCGIPTLYAWSLAYGHNLLNPDDTIDPWRIRNLIVWHRPNPPVGALGDKVRPSTSYITVAATSPQRWFDLDAERTEPTKAPQRILTTNDLRRGRTPTEKRGAGELGDYLASEPVTRANPTGAPPLDCWIDGDVWTIPTQPYKGAHYATYPPALPRRLIRLMCPQSVCVVCGEPRRRIVEAEGVGQSSRGLATSRLLGGGRADGSPGWERTSTTTLGWTDCQHNNYRRGHVLDPFAGSGTTLIAAAEQGRDATGIDLDPRNLHLARDRIGLFLEEPA